MTKSLALPVDQRKEPVISGADQGAPTGAVSMRHQPSIDVHVEELVLYGFSPADRHRIGEAVQQELERVIEERGWRHLVSTPTLIAPVVRFQTVVRSQGMGKGIAQAVFDSAAASDAVPSGEVVPSRRE